MEDLKEIYERISFLRQKGIKMKEMAEQAGYSSSGITYRRHDGYHYT